MHYYYGPMMDGNGWGFGILMLLFWLVFFVVIALITVRLLRDYGAGGRSHKDPMDIAKERYARGDITKEQFEQLKRDLHQA